MATKILVYNSWGNMYPQDNNPNKGEVLKCKIINMPNGVYLKVEGYERMLNGVRQNFPISRFKEASYGQIITFKLNKNEKKDLPRRV